MAEEDRHQKACKIVEDCYEQYHLMIYYDIRKKLQIDEARAKDVMQLLWLHVYDQVVNKGRDKMFKSYLFWKAGNINRDIDRSLWRDDPMDLSGIDLSSNKEKEDRRLEHNEKVALEMMRRQNEYQYAEPATEEEEAALFDRFWTEYSDVDLTEPQKKMAFDTFRFGYNYKEVSEKYGISKTTFYKWKEDIEIELRKSYKNKEQ